MRGGSQPEISQILDELQQLNRNLVHQTSMGEGFTTFKAEYFSRNEDMRTDLRELKVDIRNQHEDIDTLQGDVRELKEEFGKMKIDLQPIMEMKKFIKAQTFKYSSITITLLVGAIFGLGGF